jgi:hypothetical protein
MWSRQSEKDVIVPELSDILDDRNRHKHRHLMRHVLIFRSYSRIIALTAMVSGLSMTAQAAEPATLTLACKGTVTTGNGKPEPISMGVIVNFTNGAVQGFGFPAKIIDVNEVTITFNDVEPAAEGFTRSVTIDRVTGDVYVTNTMKETKTGKAVYSTDFTLKCRPAQRMF